MSYRSHRFWATVHLWLGITLGLVLAIAAVSGALLAVSDKLLRVEVPEILFPEGVDRSYMLNTPAADLPIDAWIARISKEFPELHHAEVIASPRSVPFPADVVMVAGEMNPDLAGDAERHVIVALDPATGAPLGSFVLEDTFVGNLLVFHATLLAGMPGVILVTTTGFVALVSLITGLYLWWPRTAKGWRQAFRLRTQVKGRAWLLSLHSVPAAWLFVPLFLVVLSGSYLMSPDTYHAILGGIDRLRLPEAADTRVDCQQRVSPGEAVRIALAHHPDQALRRLMTPPAECAPYIVSLMPVGTTETRASYTEVWVDRTTGAVVEARRGDDLSLSEIFISWMSPIHADLGLGWFGTAIVVLLGLVVALMYITGLLAWLRRQRNRRAAAGLGPAPAEA